MISSDNFFDFIASNKNEEFFGANPTLKSFNDSSLNPRLFRYPFALIA